VMRGCVSTSIGKPMSRAKGIASGPNVGLNREYRTMAPHGHRFPYRA
jgi:hypothetical protein